MFDQQGMYVRRSGEYGGGDGQSMVQVLGGLCFTADGNLVVIDNRIHRVQTMTLSSNGIANEVMYASINWGVESRLAPAATLLQQLKCYLEEWSSRSLLVFLPNPDNLVLAMT